MRDIPQISDRQSVINRIYYNMIAGKYGKVQVWGLSVFIAFLLSSCTSDPFRHSREERATKYIIIQPVDIPQKDVPQWICDKIEQQYGFHVNIAMEMRAPERITNCEKGLRYSADSLLQILRKIKADTSALIIGLTDTDIFTTKRDKYGYIKQPEYKYRVWGIFGLGQCPGVAAVVSTHRLKHGNGKRYKERLQKIVLHEIGHTLGLKHCTDKECYMTDAVESIATIDKASMSLCNKCSAEIE